MKRTLFGASMALGAVAAASSAAADSTPKAEAPSLTVATEFRDYTDNRGDFHSATAELKLRGRQTTALIAPTVGERSLPGGDDTAFGVRGTLYVDWSPRFSTRTSLFDAEDTPVFASLDIAQDFTLRVADKTTATLGLRWAEYFADQEVAFYSLGVRRYFERGSLAYRLTRTEAEGGDGYYAHLASVSLHDRVGKGKTQLWLSAGETAPANVQLNDTLSGGNVGAMLQRTQPLWGDVALVATAGVSSFESPWATTPERRWGLG